MRLRKIDLFRKGKKINPQNEDYDSDNSDECDSRSDVDSENEYVKEGDYKNTLLYLACHNPLSNRVRFWHHKAERWVLSTLDYVHNKSRTKDVYSNFIEAVIQQQTIQHNDKKSLFYWVRSGDLKTLKAMIGDPENKQLITKIDAAGANIIHLAYLFAQYHIAHWLVETQPELALKPYSGVISPELDSLSEYAKLPNASELMPYTGENILHIVIVRRSYEEVRWLLDFYRDHKDSVPHGLARLLTSNATGRFFHESGDFYFGGFPLHFAACSNSRDIFDLVLTFASSIDSSHELDLDEKNDVKTDHTEHSQYALKMLGPNVIFMRDMNGNTILHLCVIRGLKEMYAHVCNTASRILKKQIKNLYATMKEKRDLKTHGYRGPHVLPTSDDDHGGSGDNTGQQKGFLPISKPIYIPEDDDKYEEWLEMETKTKVDERLVLALNEQLHSPLTLAAADIRSKNKGKPEMIAFLLQQTKNTLWTYGPIKCSILSLDGLEVDYNVDRYKITRKNLEENQMFDAIDWLCITESEQSVMIPEIKQIIETKWNRFGKPKFRVSFVMNFIATVGVTLVLIFGNSTVTSTADTGSEIAVDIIYPILVIIYLSMAIPEFPYVLKYGTDYWGSQGGIRGVAKFDHRVRTVKMLSFLCACVCKIVISFSGDANIYRDEVTNERIVPSDGTNAEQAFVVFMAVCGLASWLHMYYYLMGFDTTGPFIITLFKIVSKDVPYFMQFYSVVVIAFACSLALVTNNGTPTVGYAFWHVAISIWSLLQVTVGADLTYDSLDLENVPNSMFWLADILLTGYFSTVVLLLLNLLIAMISITFEIYTSYNVSLLLIEKVNIMSAMERSMTEEEQELVRKLYCIIQDPPSFERDDEIRRQVSKKALSRRKRKGKGGGSKSSSAPPRSAGGGGAGVVGQALQSIVEVVKKLPSPRPADSETGGVESSVAADTPRAGKGTGVDGEEPLLAKTVATTTKTIAKKNTAVEDVDAVQSIGSDGKDDRGRDRDIDNVEDDEEDSRSLEAAADAARRERTERALNDDNGSVASGVGAGEDRPIGLLSRSPTTAGSGHPKAGLLNSSASQANLLLNVAANAVVNTATAAASVATVSAEAKVLGSKITMNDFFSAKHSSLKTYAFEYQEVMEDWWDASQVMEDEMEGEQFSFESNNRKTTLFIIDAQVDFHPSGGDAALAEEDPLQAPHPQGSLAVPGANEDSLRVAKMILENKDKIHDIFVSMDSHYPTHIAHKISWTNDAGEEPAVFSQIYHDDVKDRRWYPKDPKQYDWAVHYTKALEHKGRMVLTIWPEHCIVGSPGHSIVPAVNHALQEWAKQSKRPVTYILKGQNLRTEMYSALEAEVEDPLDSSTALNTDLISMLRIADRLVVCGQAMSHCVNYTLRSIMQHWQGNMNRLVLLTNGASSVDGFQQQGEELMAFAKKQGVTLSTTERVFLNAAVEALRKEELAISSNDNKNDKNNNNGLDPCGVDIDGTDLTFLVRIANNAAYKFELVERNFLATLCTKAGMYNEKAQPGRVTMILSLHDKDFLRSLIKRADALELTIEQERILSRLTA